MLAAAPDLLAALEVARDEMLAMNVTLRQYGRGHPEDGAHPDCAVEVVRAALAKAKGEA